MQTPENEKSRRVTSATTPMQTGDDATARRQRLQEVTNTAHTLGLKLVELGLFEPAQWWRLDSRLSGGCLHYCTSIDDLEAQLALFASTSKTARDFWLLGVGVSDGGEA